MAPTGAPESSALNDRVRSLRTLCGQSSVTAMEAASSASNMARLLDTATHATGIPWLLHLVFVSELPSAQRMQELEVLMALNGPDAVIARLLELAANRPRSWATDAPIRFVRSPVIEVSRTATTPLHTGIQRVVRQLAPRWVTGFGAELVVLDPQARVLRAPSVAEAARVLNWGSSDAPASGPDDPCEIIVPWQTQVVLPEYSPDRGFGTLLAPLARWSGNEVGALFYDAIPYAFPDLVPDRTLNAFGRHIAVLRGATRISAISRTAAADLTALASVWENAGIAAPPITAQPLPLEPLARAETTGTTTADLTIRTAVLGTSDLPLVLSVSSITPHKNQLSILLAAERLWGQGHQFQLLFIAGSGWDRENFDTALAQLQQRGRPVRVMSQASEEHLWAAYQLARFSIFVSITEGFGLPAAESIAAGTPVVLSGHGSMREIGEGGGAEFVNPHNLTDITNAMHRLLTDDERLDELRTQARDRRLTTWDDYATDAWNWLVEGKQPARAR